MLGMFSSEWDLCCFEPSCCLGSRQMPQPQSGLAARWTWTSRPWMPSTTNWLKSWRRGRGITSIKSGCPANRSDGIRWKYKLVECSSIINTRMNLFIPQGPFHPRWSAKSEKAMKDSTFVCLSNILQELTKSDLHVQIYPSSWFF